MKKKKGLTAEEHGSKGGKTTLERYGRGHFSKASNKRWSKKNKKLKAKKQNEKINRPTPL